jgi:hypothetical protein
MCNALFFLYVPFFYKDLSLKGIFIVNRFRFLCLALLAFAGCGGVSVTPNPTQVDVEANVTSGGKPVDDVRLVLLALDDKGGGQAQGSVAKGKVKLSVYPGKYTYFVEEGKTDASIKKIPEIYLTGNKDRTIDISSGSTIDIKLD